MKTFINDLKEGKRKPLVFSETLVEDYPAFYNESTRKITRNSFSTFFTDNMKRDSVVLFYNSKVVKNQEILSRYLNLCKTFYAEQKNQEFIGFGYFDMGLNSHHVF